MSRPKTLHPSSSIQASAPASESSSFPDRSAAATMKRNGKSFWFASLFLPRETAADAATLYQFCRVLDDIADGEGTSEANVSHRETDAPARLAKVRADLRQRKSKNTIVQQFLDVATRCSLDLAAAEYLVDALIRDAAEDVSLSDVDELIRYCYGVAGTVGVLMCGILGASPDATICAIDLGIAMQLTNIARDVLEDARNNRRYLPATWLEFDTKTLSPIEIARSPEHHESVSKAIEGLLHLADRYYAAAALGFPAIPGRSRNAIRIAAAIYREIGVVLDENDFRWWQGRTYVPLSRKLRLAATVYLGRSNLERLVPLGDVAQLHNMIAGLPGVR